MELANKVPCDSAIRYGRQRLSCTFPRLSWALLLAAAASAILGCGKSSGSANVVHLKGRITLDGQPIPSDASGSITFKPTRGGQGKTTFSTIEDGLYDSPETPKGPVKIYISIQQPTGKMISEAGGTPYAEMRSLVPNSYAGGIDMDFSEDNLSQDFDLK